MIVDLTVVIVLEYLSCPEGILVVEVELADWGSLAPQPVLHWHRDPALL